MTKESKLERREKKWEKKRKTIKRRSEQMKAKK